MKTKPTGKIPGKLWTFEGTDYLEFHPQQSGGETNQQTVINDSKGVRYWKNEGKKQESYSLHVNVEGSECDPATAIMEKAMRTLGPLMKKEPKAPRLKYLEDTDELKVWHRRSEHQLCAQIQLDTSQPLQQLSGQLFRLAAEINKIICSQKF